MMSAFDALLPARCGDQPGRFDSAFFLDRDVLWWRHRAEPLGFGYEVRVNWLTGGVDIVPINRS